MNTPDKYSYIGGATALGVTLQGTLMNHSSNVHSLINLVKLLVSLQNFTSIPFIFVETNSLYNESTPGLSNSFGAALWGNDYNLYSASVRVRRVHMHQGRIIATQAGNPSIPIKPVLGRSRHIMATLLWLQ
jgi:hypothetical protein